MNILWKWAHALINRDGGGATEDRKILRYFRAHTLCKFN